MDLNQDDFSFVRFNKIASKRRTCLLFAYFYAKLSKISQKVMQILERVLGQQICHGYMLINAQVDDIRVEFGYGVLKLILF